MENKVKRIGIDARFYGPIGKGLGRYTQEVVDNVIFLDKENEYVIFLSQKNFADFRRNSKKVNPVRNSSGALNPAGIILKSQPARPASLGEAGEAGQPLADNPVHPVGNFNFHRGKEQRGIISNGVKKVLADVHWYTLSEQIIMPWLIWRERLDLMHFPHFNVPIFTPVKFVVTIHDLILTKFPTIRATTLSPFLYKIKNLAYKIIIWLAVKRAKIIIAVSQFTKDDVAEQFKIEPQKIKVTYEGVARLRQGYGGQARLRRDDDGQTKKFDDRQTLLGYNIGSPFLLYVGNAYPHKNLEGLVKVFSVIHKKRPNFRLVLVGRQDYFYKRVEEFTKKYWPRDNPVIFPGFVPDEKLEVLFREALAYIFPSFYEGFGLPPLEAMANGCPVVSSDKSSLPEILGEAAIYFNPENEGQMLSQIEKIIEDNNLRQELIKKGYEQVKKYSWQKCARETLKVYKEVLEN